MRADRRDPIRFNSRLREEATSQSRAHPAATARFNSRLREEATLVSHALA